jgi:tetratricopeptide (TPR) repeat protein
MVNRTLGNRAAATTEFEEAISLDQGLGQAYIELARLHVEQDSVFQAVSILNDGIRHNPDDGKIRSELRLVLARQSTIESPLDPNAYLELGEALLNRKDLKGAAEQLSRAIELDDGLSEAYLYLGWIRGKGSDFRGAIDLVKKGMALSEEHQQDGARMIRVLSQNLALQQRTNDPRALYFMALWEHDNERYGMAVDLLTRSIALDPDYQDALWVLGDIFVQSKLRTADTGVLD